MDGRMYGIMYILAVLVVIVLIAIKLLYAINRDRRDIAKQLRDCIEMRGEYVLPVNDTNGEVLDTSQSDILSKDVNEVCINIDTDNIGNVREVSSKVNYNSCVMIKREWNDYRYLDKLLDKGQAKLFTGKVLYIYVSGCSNEIIMNPKIWHYNHLFYINADRLKMVDNHLYEELLKVHESYTYHHSQHQLDIIHRFFNRLSYTGVEDIDRLISKGRGGSGRYMRLLRFEFIGMVCHYRSIGCNQRTQIYSFIVILDTSSTEYYRSWYDESEGKKIWDKVR